MHTASNVSALSQPVSLNHINPLSDLTEAANWLLTVIEQRACAAAKEQWLLLEAGKQQVEAVETSQPLTVESTAELFDITPQTVLSWRKRNILLGYKLGNRWYFKRSEVLAALQAQSTPDGKRKYARRQYQQKAR